ncbi:uncharacterized protein LOC113859266 [Abrus precatorius]|uniref:Uncharacterized protein LOC113859266 n=1 Tax=Abrus precatorius TaxID=3816 RepID=A0A8B8KX08_ABRPR|nr:uncharacterized protein LOC113859266 [Abrus precatorius]
MEVEVVLPMAAPVDFNFDSNCSSPYITAPSSPQRFGNFFFSAPTSPTRGASSFFNDFPSSPVSSVPFHWEQKPGVPKSNANDDDFEFNFSGHLDRPSLSADELFDGGKIRPLKPPPRLQSPESLSPATSPRSKISQGKKTGQRDLDFDPFTAAMKETRRREEKEEEAKEEKRGRERVSGSGRKGSRSLSPLRISDIVCDAEDKGVSSSSSNPKPFFLSSIPFTKGYRKWRLRDFLLFRSASEGRATDKDPLRKYVVLSKKGVDEDVRNASFRSTESSGSASRRRGPVSAHELHYTVNRAASEEMKKKTFLPYKQGLLGCLGFNPGMHHISKGIGSLTRS